MTNFNPDIRLDDILAPALEKIKEKVRQELENRASEIIVEEIAKFTIELASLIHVQDIGKELVITIRKEI